MLPVVELAVDADRSVCVLELAQVVEDAHPLLRAEPLDQAAEELRAARLVAAALAQELALEGVERVDVVAGPGRGRGAVERQVVVDSRDERVDVMQHLLALGPGGEQHVGLLRELGLGRSLGVKL